MSKLLPDKLSIYCEQFSSPEPDHLYHLSRQTHLRTSMPQMLSGQVQGRLLSMLSRMIQPERILDIGTFTGYSALCLAEGLPPHGKLISLELDPELETLHQEFIDRSPFATQIEVRYGSAAESIQQLNEVFDMVFLDADKGNYGLYFDLLFDKISPGGWIIADNVLYQGEVLDMKSAGRQATAMHAFNQKIREDSRVECVLLSVRDGLMLIHKKEGI